MPELPEVEVVRRGLQGLLPGRRIESIQYSGKPLRRPVDLAAMRSELTSRTITAVGRRAKHLIIHMDSQTVLIIHLGMTKVRGAVSGKTYYE